MLQGIGDALSNTYGKWNNAWNNPNALSAMNTLAGALQAKGRYAGARGTDNMLSYLLRGNQGGAVGRTLGVNPGGVTQPTPGVAQAAPTNQGRLMAQTSAPAAPTGGNATQAAMVPPTPETPKIDINKLAAALSGNFPNGTGNNAGSPVPNPLVPQLPNREYAPLPQQPFVKSFDKGPNAMDLMMLNALNEPNYLPDLIKQRQANEIANKAAAVNEYNALLEQHKATTGARNADISALKAPVDIAHTQALTGAIPSEIALRRAQAGKTIQDTRTAKTAADEAERVAKLPVDQRAEEAARLKSIGTTREAEDKRTQENIAREAEAVRNDSYLIPEELKKTGVIPRRFNTFGDLVRAGRGDLFKMAAEYKKSIDVEERRRRGMVEAAGAGNKLLVAQAKSAAEVALRGLADYDKLTFAPGTPQSLATMDKRERTPSEQREYEDLRRNLNEARLVLGGYSPGAGGRQGGGIVVDRSKMPIEEEVVKDGVWYTKRGGEWGRESTPKPTTPPPAPKPTPAPPLSKETVYPSLGKSTTTPQGTVRAHEMTMENVREAPGKAVGVWKGWRDRNARERRIAELRRQRYSQSEIDAKIKAEFGQ